MSFGKYSIKLILFLSPFLLILISYFIMNPFRVLYAYHPTYISTDGHFNRDYMSTETYLKNRGRFHFNSFIFGNSKTLAFQCEDWKQHLNPDAIPYHYDASAESIFGIYHKLKFIDKLHDSINNVIILMDNTVLLDTVESSGALFLHHPATIDGSWAKFQLAFITTYFSKAFFLKNLDFQLFKKYRSYMNAAVDPRDIRYDTINNNYYLYGQEVEFQKNPDAYLKNNKKRFKSRGNTYMEHESAIQAGQLNLLKKTKALLDKHHTHYQIIVSPIFDQVCFNKKDLKILEDIFGKEYVHDYSGINKYTKDIHNFYESAHYRPVVAHDIMDNIYGNASASEAQNAIGK